MPTKMPDRRDILTGLGATALGLACPTIGGAMTKSLYVPPEEALHARTFMQWPNSPKVYREAWHLEETQAAIATIANAISDFEPVVMLADAALHKDMRRHLSDAVEIWDIATEDLWCRDSGPLFAMNGSELVVSHIQFNGWGNKQEHRHDKQIASRVADHLGLPLVSSGVTGEAGGVEHDGHGALIAHESSWVNKNRNAGMSRAEIEKRLLAAYGADRMIWTKGVYGQDITDYHIDSLARFTGAGRVLMNLPDRPDRRDPFHMAAIDTHDALVGAGFEVDVIPEPIDHRAKDPDFVASYANYYVCNNAVISAQFGDRETDAIAAKTLARHFPDREILQLNVDALGYLGGGIHCATQQMPLI